MRNRILPCGGWIATLRAAILGEAVLAVAAPGAAAADFPSARSRSSCPMPGRLDRRGGPHAGRAGREVRAAGAGREPARRQRADRVGLRGQVHRRRLHHHAGDHGRPGRQSWLYQLPYDVLHDFAPIVTAVKMPSFIVVNPQTPVKSVPQLTDYLRNNRVSYATAGTGTPSHLAMEMYKVRQGRRGKRAVQGRRAGLQDVMAGHVPVMVALAPRRCPTSTGASSGPGRDQRRAVSFLPDVPAVTEYPDLKGLRDRSMAGLRGAGGRRRRQHAQPGHQ